MSLFSRFKPKPYEAKVELESVTVLSLKPGDVLVVKTKRPWPASAYQRTKRQLQGIFPDNEFIFVDGNGLEFEVITPLDPGEEVRCRN